MFCSAVVFFRKFSPCLFFIGLLALGVTVVRDYGTYIDEFTNYAFGLRWYEHVTHVITGTPAPAAVLTEHDAIHGPAFELVLAALEKAAHVQDPRQIVFFRHYVVWSTFYLSALCFYFVARALFRNRGLALLSTIFLVLQPRIFSHAFYDSVDLPFLSFYIFSLATLFRYLARPTLASLCLHAAISAFLIDIRLIGAAIPAITLLVLWSEPTTPAMSHALKVKAQKTAVYLSVLGGFALLCWPYLWANPLARLIEVVQLTPRIAWDGQVLYLGEHVRATRLPWHYLPVWIAVTTPLACSILFLVGFFVLLTQFTFNPLSFLRQRPREFAVLAAFLLPLAVVIGLHATIYDSWRHMFFIFPPFALIAVAGWRALTQAFSTRLSPQIASIINPTLFLVIGVNLGAVIAFMVRSHPYENVYFNRLAGRDLRQAKARFEMDYWGLSYRTALEYVVQHDPSVSITVYDSLGALPLINRYMLRPPDRDRVHPTDFASAEYVFTIFRAERNGYPTLPVYFTVDVDGTSIMAVYKKSPAHL